MPPKTSPPLSPQQLLAQCRWPAAPHQLPARLAPTHQDAGSPALLSLLPPCSQCPMPTVGLGWGRVTPVPWCPPGGPGPSVLQIRPKTLFSSHLKRQHTGQGLHSESPGGYGQPNGQLLQALLPKVGASVSSCHQAPAGCPTFPLPKHLLGHQSPVIPES